MRRYPDRVSLRSLPSLLRNEPAMTRVVGARGATLAVATPAQAFVLAGLHPARDPASGAGGDAHRPAAVAAGPRPRGVRHRAGGRFRRPVEVFPAWETLPFERVSPEVHTMGRRLRLLWQVAGPDAGTRVRPGHRRGPGQGRAAAPRAVADRGRPVVVATGRPGGGRGAGGRSGGHRATGASPWSSTAANWPSAAASSTCSRRPATSRSASTCGATRWTG